MGGVFISLLQLIFLPDRAHASHRTCRDRLKALCA
jgi:hypothetical protein